MATPHAASAKTKPQRPVKSGKTIQFPILYFLILGGVSFLSVPGGILIVGGTLPTLAAWLSDRAPGKPFGVSVGLLNMSAVILFLVRVVPFGHHFDKAMDIVADGVTWLVIYSFAFAGWGIYFGLPLLIHRVLASQIQKNINRIRDSQREMIALWGRDVAGASPASGKSLAD